jgi:CD2 antigen cytoplasmic tail-binding protein 2
VDRGEAEDAPNDLMNPRLAAKERAKRRSQFTAELFTEESRGILNDVVAAEVDYKVCFFIFLSTLALSS